MESTCVCVARTASRSGPLADLALLDWLEAHLPDGHRLADLPPPPDLDVDGSTAWPEW